MTIFQAKLNIVL